ncbi:HK97 gp10 family phage protein [Bacillus pacificus]|uniref:HK97 gp10 family phage protein n=1 Tax=Bacillus pacificus TaxID=2026187 RepID=UPI003D200756
MIRIEDLANEITKQVETYTQEVKDDVKKIQVEVAKQGVSTLKKLNKPKLTGKYRKGWRVKEVDGDVFIHNATHYQLTHLLEKGHAKVNGSGRVPGTPHIQPVEQKVNQEYERRVEEAVKR